MIKKAFLLLSSLALFSCAPNSPVEKGPQSISFSLDTIEEEPQEDSLLQIRFHIEDLKIDSSYASSESLEKKIRQRLLANNNSSQGDYTNYAELISKMKDEYRTLSQENEMTQAWELGQNIKVVLNEGGLFGLQSSHFSYTGGAHGNTFIDNQTYRLDNGELLLLDSLLIPEEKASFIDFCESKFREAQEISAQGSLEANGFWFEKDSFRISDNFSYSRQGLNLIYNSYEIAPYASGIIRVSLSLNEVEPFLKPKYLLPLKEEAGV